jgi:hypothetical protein
MLTPTDHLTPPAIALACRYARAAVTDPAYAGMTAQAVILRIEAWRVLTEARGGRIREARLRAAIGLPVTEGVAGYLAGRMTDTPPGAA